MTRTLLKNRANVAFAARTFFNREPPPHYLEEWIERLAQPEEHVEQDLLSLVIFRLHDEHLAVQTSWLVEVTLPQPIHAIPHRTNDVVLGLVNIRGQLRICFSAHGLLGVALPARNEQTHHDDVTRAAAYVASLDRMLILHERSEQWVFPVEEVLGVHRLPMHGPAAGSLHVWKSRRLLSVGFHLGESHSRLPGRNSIPLGVKECLQVSGDLSGFSLYDLFRTEAESQTAILSEGILALEQSGSSPTAIEPLMRAAHSLKGAARIVGMNAAERLAHALEEVFVAAQKGIRVLDSSHVDVLLASVDLLGEVSRIAEGGVEAWLQQHGARLEGQIDTLLAIERGTWIAPDAQLFACNSGSCHELDSSSTKYGAGGNYHFAWRKRTDSSSANCRSEACDINRAALTSRSVRRDQPSGTARTVARHRPIALFESRPRISTA